MVIDVCPGSAATWYFFVQQRDFGLPPEATDRWHFLAFFLSGPSLSFTQTRTISLPVSPAGMFSGLVSHVASTKVLFPRLVKQMSTQASIKASPAASAIAGTLNNTPLATQRGILPSLGASGAVYASVTLTALAFPDTEVRLILPVFPPIPISMGVGGIVLMDVMGILRGWRSVPPSS